MAQTSYGNFYDSLNKKNPNDFKNYKTVIFEGDVNGDVNPNVHDLKDIMIINSFNNIISQPTRQHALLDPIIIHNHTSFLHQGILELASEISDHRSF